MYLSTCNILIFLFPFYFSNKWQSWKHQKLEMALKYGAHKHRCIKNYFQKEKGRGWVDFQKLDLRIVQLESTFKDQVQLPDYFTANQKLKHSCQSVSLHVCIWYAYPSVKTVLIYSALFLTLLKVGCSNKACHNHKACRCSETVLEAIVDVSHHYHCLVETCLLS